ncbi:MAG: class I SAM-dependent methyltransferase [Clostridiales bacterium]|nr:class I SAM-dependent methyltransferase [Clostridiales bacterium]
MNEINDEKTVKKQYASSSGLATRISIHDKYSTNKMGFGNWIFSNYEIRDGMKILELGCGTGSMWTGHEVLLEKNEIILSDYSEAMVETAKEKLGEHPNVTYQRIDIMDIPFADETFDVVIANMMLYHVPDLSKALSEVRRVLKTAGTFYCATFGTHGIMEYLSEILSGYGVKDTTNKNFTLQNGAAILGEVFPDVRCEVYPDALEVTDIEDLIDYIYSLESMTALSAIPKETIRETLTSHMENGVLHVPKEYGMFIASGIIGQETEKEN